MALSHAIMTALLEEDLTGYELAKQFDTSLGFFWRASHQQIYQELRKMADNAWLSARSVEQSGKPNKVIYSLTNRGKETLDQWVLAAGKVQPAKDDFMVKLYNVGHCDIAPILAELDDRQQASQEHLALYRRIRHKHYANPKLLPNTKKGVYLALLAGIRQQEFFQQWCNDARSLLRTVKAN
ncbi:MAG: PadR family transcriptional regulator [Pseudomonadales bacterium]